MRKREDKEALEFKILSPFAKKAAESRGRKIHEEKCEFRTDFQRDRDRIIHSRAFRRLKHKTQVFIAPFGDHYRTRLTHTLEVSQIARTIASSLALNEDLTEAISLGHDLGHTPFGHDGENIIREVYSKDFRHNKQSLRVVDILEKNERRRGLNLTEEVRDGILNHTGAGTPTTLEGQVVKTADRIAYINHDIDDAIRSGVITEDDLPREWTRVLGSSNTARINSLVVDMIEASDGKPAIAQSPAFEEAMLGLRAYMFENIYADERVKAAVELEKVRRVVTSLYEYYLKNPGEISGEYMELIEADGIETVAKDMVAGMTDNFAEEMYGKLFSPKC